MPSFSRQAVLAGICFIVVAGLAAAHAASGPSADNGITPPFMHDMANGMDHGMMGHGMMGMGPAMMHAGSAMHDSQTMAQLSAIHELFLNHDRIKRTVTNLPDGIRTTTESDDPHIAQLLKDHVADMGKRVEIGDDPGLPIESDALHAIFKDYSKIQTKVETTDKGVVVTQTSADKETVTALQQHATEVSDFVAQGMAAMRTAMMKRMASMMPAGMHSPMYSHHPEPQQQ